MNNILKLLLAATSVFMVAACGGGDDSIDDRIDVADPKLRFVHAIPLGPNLTLFRGTAAQSDATNVGYKFASKYFDIETGPASWPVKTTTGNIEIGSTVAIDAKRGNKYTLVAVPGTDNAVVMIDDPFNKSITANNARVRVLNASFNAPSVDVYLNAPGTNINTVGPNFAAVGYKQANPASGGDSFELAGGTYQLRITAAGTKTVIFNSTVMIANNVDWLLLTVPDGVPPNAVKVLIANPDDTSTTMTELTSQ